MLLADVSETSMDLVATVISSTLAAKAWFATAAVVLAGVRVFFHCVTILGFETPDTWVAKVQFSY